MKIIENEIMKNYSNMRVGGKSKKVIIVEDKNELKEIFNNNENIFILGNGSNILFSDNYIDKTFVCMKNLKNIELLEKNIVKVDAGASIKNLLDFMKDYNLTGIESLTGIPGTIGGLIYMNGGAFGSEIFDNIISVEILDESLNIVDLKKEEIEYSYRYTEFQKKKCVILSATFHFDNNYDDNKLKEIRELREIKHPLDKPSLGSTFKNPSGDFAARLISECNLKSYRVGGAEVSSKHPNFVLNLGSATCKDIEEILKHIKEEVYKKFNILLEEEIIIVK